MSSVTTKKALHKKRGPKKGSGKFKRSFSIKLDEETYMMLAEIAESQYSKVAPVLRSMVAREAHKRYAEIAKERLKSDLILP